MRKTIIAVGFSTAAVAALAFATSRSNETTVETEPSVPVATEENIAQIKALFEKIRAESITYTDLSLAARREASPDGHGRITLHDNVATIYSGPLDTHAFNFDIERNAETAANRVLAKDPSIFLLKGDDFETSVVDALISQDYLSIDYVPSTIIVHQGPSVATYNLDSDRVCQPIAEAWQGANSGKSETEGLDCFPAAELSADAPLAKDIATIKQHVAGINPAP